MSATKMSNFNIILNSCIKKKTEIRQLVQANHVIRKREYSWFNIQCNTTACHTGITVHRTCLT